MGLERDNGGNSPQALSRIPRPGGARRKAPLTLYPKSQHSKRTAGKPGNNPQPTGQARAGPATRPLSSTIRSGSASETLRIRLLSISAGTQAQMIASDL
jgi:hypothetical protein